VVSPAPQKFSKILWIPFSFQTHNKITPCSWTTNNKIPIKYNGVMLWVQKKVVTTITSSYDADGSNFVRNFEKKRYFIRTIIVVYHGVVILWVGKRKRDMVPICTTLKTRGFRVFKYIYYEIRTKVI